MEDTTRTAELRRKLEKDPGSRLFAQFAEELRKEGRHDEAIAVTRKGLESNPNYPSARLTLARSLYDSGRPAEARPELELVLKASADNILAGRLLGEVLEELGEFAPALAQLEKTLRYAPGDKAILERIAAVKARMKPLVQAAVAPASPAVAAEPPPLPSIFAEATAPGPVAPALAPPPAPASAPPLPSVALPAALSPAAPPSPAKAPAAPTPEPQRSRPAVAAPAPPAPSVALDRDLASGTLNPGALSVSDLGFGPPPVPEPISASVSASARPSTEAPAPPATPAPTPAAAPPEAADADVGGQTLPLSSVTLAELYLQQGLKAEASAVLEQVMKRDPENAQAKTALDAVANPVEPSAALASVIPVAAVALVSAPTAPAAAPVAPKPPKRSRAVVREQTVLSLKALQSAVEREALLQRATEQKAL